MRKGHFPAAAALKDDIRSPPVLVFRSRRRYHSSRRKKKKNEKPHPFLLHESPFPAGARRIVAGEKAEGEPYH
jgi:hypothetical protein